MSVTGTDPVFENASGVSIPGTRVTTAAPGLKPSLVFISAGLTWTPRALVGVESGASASRLPVSVPESDSV